MAFFWTFTMVKSDLPILGAGAMHLDVLDLRNFYYRTQLGRVAQRAIRDQVGHFWPEAKGQSVAGFGFAVPLLRPFLPEARRVIGLMPGPQGVMAWPMGEPNVSILCEETRWPIPTGLIDKLVVMHALETSEQPSALLEECFRVLGPGGRALFVVPNRTGLWARRDATPFGYGRPYSLGQLETLLKHHGFVPEKHLAALFAPPSQKRFWLRAAPFCENVGQRISTVIAGGVLMLEVSKTSNAARGKPAQRLVRRPLRVLDSAPMPGIKPA
jgi:SAM-dependent methyltransferase